MNYRALVIVASLLAMGTATADDHAQGGKRGPDVDRLATALELDDTQKQEVERIIAEHRAIADAMREEIRASGERPDRAIIQAHREEMRTSFRAELATVLTAEQLDKLDAMREQRRESRPTRRHRQDDAGNAEGTAL